MSTPQKPEGLQSPSPQPPPEPEVLEVQPLDPNEDALADLAEIVGFRSQLIDPITGWDMATMPLPRPPVPGENADAIGTSIAMSILLLPFGGVVVPVRRDFQKEVAEYNAALARAHHFAQLRARQDAQRPDAETAALADLEQAAEEERRRNRGQHK